MDELVKALAEARINYSKLRDAIDKEDQRFTLNVQQARKLFDAENAELISAHDEAKRHLDKVEQALRNTAIQEYERTKNKALHKFVSVRVSKSYEYDKGKALEWAKANAAMLVSEQVDTKGFEAVIKAAKQLPEFVTVNEKATAVIASNLN